MTSSNEWRIHRQVWAVLLMWGLAVMVLAGLLSAWIWKNEREQDAENAKVQREQDRAMCVMLDLFVSGPPPVAGPDGDRDRAALEAIQAYRRILHCEDFEAERPVSPRPR